MGQGEEAAAEGCRGSAEAHEAADGLVASGPVAPGCDTFGLVYVSGPVALHSRPEPEAPEVFRTPPRIIAEATLGPGDGSSGPWALLAPGELRRFGAPHARDLWLQVDGRLVRWVGGRSRPEGEIWLDRDALPSGPEPLPPLLAAGEPPASGQAPASKADLGAPLDSLASAITDTVLHDLQAKGFAILDAALPTGLCSQLRSEMEALLEHDQYWESQTYGSDEGALHHNIVETTLDFREVPRYAPIFSRMEQDQGLLQQLRRLPSLQNLEMQHLRLQVNKGNGGCYTMHTDSGVTESESGSQILKATALFYLNEDWREGDGGELRLFPFPRPPVEIAPLNGRLVLFEPRMVHEVLPNFRRRFCFTLWCAAGEEASGGNSFLDMELDSVTGLEQAVATSEAARRAMGNLGPHAGATPWPLRALFLPELRPLIVRYVWRACELEAAQRSHHDGPQKRAMLEGIGHYHREMDEFNPRWLRDLLESLPKALEAAPSPGTATGREPRVGPRELAELVQECCVWWE
mmetsp:Transcript_100344/g.323852  ORF Transcript_100344/g.323852 Transcript_100344/m.323852 type:complete len:520 (+) Transcript_100344:39-1598(+)